jgi:UTP--glucose-1-phosphate uridylyltransferase
VINRYGVIDGRPVGDHVYAASDWIEKPSPEEAPSNLAIAGRYVFTPEIFDYLDQIMPGKNGELQLTDAMRLMVKKQQMYGLAFKGKRYDIGNKLGFLKTNLIYGLEDPEIGEELRQWLQTFSLGLRI